MNAELEKRLRVAGLDPQAVDGLVRTALAEDGGRDVTSEPIFAADATARADLVTRQDGVVAGIPVAEAVFAAVGVTAMARAADGDRVRAGDSPAAVIRKRPESSIVVGLKLQKSGHADAFVSAGSTGAVMAASLFILRPLEGVDRHLHVAGEDGHQERSARQTGPATSRRRQHAGGTDELGDPAGDDHLAVRGHPRRHQRLEGAWPHQVDGAAGEERADDDLGAGGE